MTTWVVPDLPASLLLLQKWSSSAWSTAVFYQSSEDDLAKHHLLCSAHLSVGCQDDRGHLSHEALFFQEA